MDHQDASDEIKRLQLLERCKRNAEYDNRPLRQIFDDLCRSDPDVAPLLSFADLESAMYKRRRLSQPTLPASPNDTDSVIRNSRYAQLNGCEFYRGVASAGDDGSAVIFASDRQIELLQSAKQIYFDATFKVVPSIYYQLFTIFVPVADVSFPVFFALMSRKTRAMYVAVFEQVKVLAPNFTPQSVMADFEEASVSGFQHVFGPLNVSGCWFHFAQAIVKRVNKLGLKAEYPRNADVKDTVHCLLGLPLLPANEIVSAVDDVKNALNASSLFADKLKLLIEYVLSQWIRKQSIGPERLTVRDNVSRTNNVLESYHSALRRRIQVSHPNLFTFLGHLQHVTTDAMNDVTRMISGLNVRRPKKKRNLMHETRIKTCIARFAAGSYTRHEFLRAVSHSMGAHTAAFQPSADGSENDNSNDNDDEQSSSASTQQPQSSLSSGSAPVAPPAVAAADVSETSCCEVCLVAPRTSVVLVPCGHARFCAGCLDTLSAMASSCPICRTPINMVLRVFN